MNNLFDKDTNYNEQPRDSKGRFATREMAVIDKLSKENKSLRCKMEMYRRQAEAVTDSFIRQTHELERLKGLLKNALAIIN